MCSGLQPSNSSLGTVTYATVPCDRQPDASCSDAVASSVVPPMLTHHVVKSQFISTSEMDDREDLPPIDSVELVACVARALIIAIEAPRNPEEPPDEQATPCLFQSSVVPNISIDRYLQRLKAVFRCSDAAFVLALILVDRLLQKPEQEPRRISMKTVHRLFLASLIVAVKFNEDLVYGNSHYAKGGGIQLREVNRLERYLLKVLDYNIHVHPDVYLQYERALRVLRRELGPLPVPKVAATSLAKREIVAAQSETTSQQQRSKHDDVETTRCGVASNPIARTAGYVGTVPAFPKRPDIRGWSEASTASSPCGSVTSAVTCIWNPNASPFYPKAASVDSKSRSTA